MLSVPTLWTVFVVNFLALALIWAYVMRSYPKFEAARFWTGSAFVAGGGGGGGGEGPRVVLRPAGQLARHPADHRIEFRRRDVLHRRGRQHADPGPDLFAGP